jgi:hypothetical protein
MRRLRCVTPLNTEFVVGLSIKALEAKSELGSDATPRAVRPEVVRCEFLKLTVATYKLCLSCLLFTRRTSVALCNIQYIAVRLHLHILPDPEEP